MLGEEARDKNPTPNSHPQSQINLVAPASRLCASPTQNQGGIADCAPYGPNLGQL
jgi:hypothetical protein